jgi:hypothetical protein
VNKTIQAVSWTGAADLSAISNQNVKFKFYLTTGELYSFWVTSASSGASYGYVAGGGARYTTNKDTVGLGNQGPTNQAPAVGAGPDQSIQLPSTSVTLSGTISDDGLPTGSTVTHTWSQVSGPAATINSPAALTTTVTLSAGGTYVFRLTASDTDLSGSDDVTVTVNNPTATEALHLKFDDGTGTVASDSSGNGRTGTLMTSTSELPTWLASGVPGFNGAIRFNPNQGGPYVTVPKFDPNTTDFTLAFWFNFGQVLNLRPGGEFHYIFSWGNVGTKNSIVVWSTPVAEIGGGCGASIRTLACDPNGTYLNTNSPGSGSDCLDIMDSNHITGFATYKFNDANWHHYALTFSAAGGRTVYIDGNALMHDTKDVGAKINPNTDIFIGWRPDLNSARWYGGSMDDLILLARALDANGVKALMVPATTNLAPTVNAGQDQTIALPAAANLSGTASDDHQPNPPATTTVTWTNISGPAAVTIASANSLSTSVSFLKAGTYVFRLTATDSALSAYDDVTVTVQTDLRADFTGDGHVDGFDFLRWQANYAPGVTGKSKSQGDANGDGIVDGFDFLIWQAAYGYEH